MTPTDTRCILTTATFASCSSGTVILVNTACSGVCGFRDWQTGCPSVCFLTNGHPFTGQCTRHRANPWEHVLNTSSRARVGSSCSATAPFVPVTDMVGTFAELTVFFEGSRFDAGNPGTAKAGIQNVVGLRRSALIDPRGTIWSQKKHKVAKPTHVAHGVQCWIFQRVVHSLLRFWS